MNTLDYLYRTSPKPIQNALVSAYGLLQSRKRFHGKSYVETYKKIELFYDLSDKDLDEAQSEQLYEMVRFCRKNIPYYQKIFSEYSIHEQKITSIYDINKIPILKKSTVREQFTSLRKKGSKPFFIQSTSGTTGTPLKIHLNRQSYQCAMACLAHHESTYGILPGASKATFAGRIVQKIEDNNPPFWRYNISENQTLFSIYHLNEKNFESYRNKLRKTSPEEIIGYPSALCELASFYKKFGVSPEFKPKAIITNSETLHPWQRSILEDVFNCPVADYYGTAEYVIFAGQSHDGVYKSRNPLGIPEIIKDSPDTQNGIVLGTTLCNYEMPLLRYEIGDTATAHQSVQAHHNASVNRLFTNFNGRDDDIIITKTGQKVSRTGDLFRDIPGIIEAQVIQNTPGEIEVRLVTDPVQTFDASPLHERFRLRFGDTIKEKIIITEKIQRTPSGKFRSVIRKF